LSKSIKRRGDWAPMSELGSIFVEAGEIKKVQLASKLKGNNCEWRDRLATARGRIGKSRIQILNHSIRWEERKNTKLMGEKLIAGLNSQRSNARKARGPPTNVNRQISRQRT